MNEKSYTINYKIIDNMITIDLPKLLLKAFDEDTISYVYISENGDNHNLQFKKYISNDEYFYGKCGEIKEASIQNATAMIKGKEYDDNVDFKYTTQFLIDLKNKIMIYIYNRNFNCFEEAFVQFINDKNGISSSLILNGIRDKTISEKIKNAKKIKNIVIIKKEKEDVQTLINDFKDNVISSVELKCKFSKKKNVDREQLLKYIKKNNNKNYKLEFVDSEDVNIVMNFTENLFFKTKKIVISKDEIKDINIIYEKLKEHVKCH